MSDANRIDNSRRTQRTAPPPPPAPPKVDLLKEIVGRAEKLIGAVAATERRGLEGQQLLGAKRAPSEPPMPKAADPARAMLATPGGAPQAVSPEQAVERALKGEAVKLTNSDGVTEDLAVKSLGSSDGKNNYRVTVGSNSFDVHIGEGQNDNRILGSLADSYSETPAELRTAVKNIDVKKEKGPAIETTDDPNDAAGANAGDGKITFFDGEQNLELFDHEAAHLFGRQLEAKEDNVFENIGEFLFGERAPPIPPGYEDAAKKDGNFVSSYAEDASSATGYTEDFADAWEGYMNAVDQGPAAVDAFRKQYPNRVAFLETLPRPTSAVA